MSTNEKKIFVHPDMPLEQQIAFLRQTLLSFQFNTYESLKEKLGNKGIEIFKAILRKGYRQSIDKYKEKSFAEIKKVAEIERVFGFVTKQDYDKPDELQYSITYCPFLEESKRRGLDMEFCNIMEEVESEEVSRNLAEVTGLIW